MSEKAKGKAILQVTPPETPPAKELFADVPEHWLSLGSSTSGYAGLGDDDLYKELWKACAGPLVYVPRVGERVLYFPQGHLEQVQALTNLELSEITPPVDLPSKILCTVLDIKLRAEQDTDEVYFQMNLVPEQDQSEPKCLDLYPPAPPTPMLKSFCKVLTASDATTHGRFTVRRRHANECLPALDMNQQKPMQELVAKDLHGAEWRFNHIYGGQPNRHLLTTGWNKFLASKRLVAGDSVIFLRAENGEMRVGVRRVARQRFSMSSSVLPSEGMHLAVVGPACNAVATGTPFTVLSNPRTSQFIISLNKYLEAVKNRFRVGMRIQKRFEGENSPEGRLTGTIVGDEDISSQWDNSKWPSLQVQWDEAASNRSNMVSPWDIEPFGARGREGHDNKLKSHE